MAWTTRCSSMCLAGAAATWTWEMIFKPLRNRSRRSAYLHLQSVDPGDRLTLRMSGCCCEIRIVAGVDGKPGAAWCLDSFATAGGRRARC